MIMACKTPKFNLILYSGIDKYNQAEVRKTKHLGNSFSMDSHSVYLLSPD